MDVNEITLGGGARHWAARFGIPESEIKAARANPDSTHEGFEFLIVFGRLSDGRRVRMLCPLERPHHVESFRVVFRR